MEIIFRMKIILKVNQFFFKNFFFRNFNVSTLNERDIFLEKGFLDNVLAKINHGINKNHSAMFHRWQFWAEKAASFF